MPTLKVIRSALATFVASQAAEALRAGRRGVTIWSVGKPGPTTGTKWRKSAEIADVTLLEKPYSDRQLIVVADDEIASATEKAEREIVEKVEKQTGINWTKIGELALMLILPKITLVTEVAKEAIKTWSRARAIGINVLVIGRSEAIQLEFPPGHPRDGVLYIGHPAIAKRYYTMADFHRVTFEHKFSEAVDLLMYLGATKIRVQHVRGWSKEFSSRISVPLGAAEESIEAEFGTSRASGSELLYIATFDGTGEPSVPEHLVWFPYEPTWQSIATGRINFGLRDFSLNVSYEDDFGVNAGLKATIQKSGLDIGGKFEDHQSTVWRLAGEFSPKTFA